MSQRFLDRSIKVTPVVDTSVYAAGDLMIDTTDIPGAVPKGGYGILQSITVIDKDDEGAAFDIYILDNSTSLGTINDAEAITDAKLDGVITKVSVVAGDYVNLANGQIAVKGPSDGGMGVLCEPSDNTTTSLDFAAVAQDAATYASASDLVFRFGFLRG